MSNSRSKRTVARPTGPAALLSWLFRVVVIAAASLSLLTVVGIGIYFFIDQVIVEKLDLRSPEAKIARAVTHMNSMVRDPDDQFAAIEVLRTNFPLVEPSLKLAAIEEIDRVLPTHTVAGEVIDAWIAFRKVALGREVVGPKNPKEALDNWRPGGDYAKYRIGMYVDPQWLCDADVRALALYARAATDASQIEKQVASQVEVRWLPEGECSK